MINARPRVLVTAGGDGGADVLRALGPGVSDVPVAANVAGTVADDRLALLARGRALLDPVQAGADRRQRPGAQGKVAACPRPLVLPSILLRRLRRRRRVDAVAAVALLAAAGPGIPTVLVVADVAGSVRRGRRTLLAGGGALVHLVQAAADRRD